MMSRNFSINNNNGNPAAGQAYVPLSDNVPQASEVPLSEVRNLNVIPSAIPSAPSDGAPVYHAVPVNLNVNFHTSSEAVPVASVAADQQSVNINSTPQSVVSTPEPVARSRWGERRQRMHAFRGELRQRRRDRSFDCCRYMSGGWNMYKSNCCVLTGGIVLLFGVILLFVVGALVCLSGLRSYDLQIIEGAFGSNVCPNNTVPLTFEECERAANMMDFEDDNLDDYDIASDTPHGCYTYNRPYDEDVYVGYNSGVGQGNAEMKVICKVDAPRHGHHHGHHHGHRDGEATPEVVTEAPVAETTTSLDGLSTTVTAAAATATTTGLAGLLDAFHSHGSHDDKDGADWRKSEHYDYDYSGVNYGDDHHHVDRGLKVRFFALIVGMVLFAIGMVPLGASYLIAILHAIRTGEAVKCKALFSAFSCPYWCKLLVLTIVMGVLKHIGFMLWVLPGVWMSFAFMFAVPLHREKPDLGVCGSLFGSILATHTYPCQLFGFALLLALINIGGAMLLGFGLLFTIPLTTCCFIYCYSEIVGADQPREESDGDLESEDIPVAYAVN